MGQPQVPSCSTDLPFRVPANPLGKGKGEPKSSMLGLSLGF